MDIMKALSKQLFGARYESVCRSFIACLILFFAVDTAGIKITVAPTILFLTATVFSAGIMWQALNAIRNADSTTGMFMLPFADREMTFSVVLALTGYTLITKTLPVLTLFFSVHEWSAVQIATSLLCGCNGCSMAAAWYTMIKRKRLLPFVLLWCGAMLLSIFFVRIFAVFAVTVLTSLLVSTLLLLLTDAYVFYCPASAKLLVKRKHGTGSVLLYLLRYLVTNKNYLLNTAGLCVIAAVLLPMFGQFAEWNAMPLGFAVLCLNTPICVLLSCDPGLEQAVRVLPEQASRFCVRYCFFVSFVNMAVSSVYLVSWQIQQGGVSCIDVITAVLIALQSAILSALLEWLYPIRNWKLESDLWHHPRKYIVPLMMLLMAGPIGMWSAGVWILPCVVLVEVLSLSFIARRI